MCNAHEGVLACGKEMGIEIGRNSQKLESARKMILKGMTFEDINELTDLTYSEILNLSNQMNH